MIKLILKHFINTYIVKLNQFLNINIWNSIQSSHRGTITRNCLNNELQDKEYELVKHLSEQLVSDVCKRNSTFSRLRKSPVGYRIQRCCYSQTKQRCYWNININLNTNEAIISCNQDCNHSEEKKS